jgi:hypothetical protein
MKKLTTDDTVPIAIGMLGDALFELIIICNYIVITLFNSVKLCLTPW